jgi:hypothetical protein
MCKPHIPVICSVIASLSLAGCLDAPGATSVEDQQALEAKDVLEEETIFDIDDEEKMNQLSPEVRSKISEARALAGDSADLSVVYNPRFAGLRIDYCVVWAAQCGLPAASIACKLYGLRTPVSYGVLWNYGLTYVLASDRICAASFCDALEWVVCDT